MIDVSTLVNLIGQDRKPQKEQISGFVEPPQTNRNPGGFSDPTESFSHEERLWRLAEMNPNMWFYSNRLGRVVSGWELLQASASYSQYHPTLEEQVHEVRLRAEHLTGEIAHTQMLAKKAEVRGRNAGKPGMSARDAAVAGWKSGSRSLVQRAEIEARDALSGRGKRGFTVREILTGR